MEKGQWRSAQEEHRTDLASVNGSIVYTKGLPRVM